MSLNKGIEHKKEHREEYYGSKAIDPTCRNHGSCTWCFEDRIAKHKRREKGMDDRYKEWLHNSPDDTGDDRSYDDTDDEGLSD